MKEYAVSDQPVETDSPAGPTRAGDHHGVEESTASAGPGDPRPEDVEDGDEDDGRSEPRG